jgi:transposase
MSQQAVVSLTAEEEQTLRQWARAGTSEHRLVERAKVILLLHEGKANLEIARQLKTRPARISKWRQRFARHRLDGLKDADRKGRPSIYGQTTEKRVLALLDEPPPPGYGKWSGPLVAKSLKDVSDDQVWRILRKYDICLERRRSWCITTDPEFGPKAADIVGLYLNPPQNALVLCVDEKPSIQALERAQGGCDTA